jgi:hypothetical protein
MMSSTPAVPNKPLALLGLLCALCAGAAFLFLPSFARLVVGLPLLGGALFLARKALPAAS